MATWYAAPAATGSGSGLDENNAATLSGAALLASAADDIYCDVGTYSGILVPGGVSVYGGFDFAAFVADPALRDLDANVSLIDLGPNPGFTFSGTGSVVDGFTAQRSSNATINLLYLDGSQSATGRNLKLIGGVTDGYSSEFQIRGSAALALENCQATDAYSGGAVYCSDTASLTAKHCSFTPSRFGGFTVRVRSSAVGTFENCIFSGQASGMLELVTGTIEYSIIPGGFAGTGNVDADPLYVDSANGDFELQPGSPAIGAANPATALSTDRLLRTRDGSPDMGPLEFQSAGGVEFTASCLSSSSSGAALSVGREFTASALSGSAVDAGMIVGRQFTASAESSTSVTASITVSSAIQFTASCLSGSSGTGLLTVGRKFVAVIESEGNSNASVSVGRAFTASCESSTASGAALTIARAFTANCESDTSCVAAITVAREFTASAESSTEVAATISVTSAIQFTASCLSGSQGSGTLSVGRSFTASTESESSAAGQLTVAREFTASVESGSESTAQLTIGNAVQFVASCRSGSSSSATLTVGREFTAAVESESSAEAALVVGRSFVASSESDSSAQASVTVGRRFTASALSESQCSAIIRTTAGIQFTASCVSTTSCAALMTKAQAEKPGDVEAATTRRAGPAPFTRQDRPATFTRG